LSAKGAGFGALRSQRCGAVAQLGERVLCKHEVRGSIPLRSTCRFSRKMGGSSGRS
jgi:hypothetical protein